MVAAGDGKGQPCAPRAHKRLASWAPVLCALAAAALYLQTLHYGLVFDDLSLLGPQGPRLLGNGVIPYRPARWLSYLVDFHAGGGAAWVYHGVNVILHAAVCALAALTALSLGAGPTAALAAGLLPACHPLSVEAVAYVAGRRDLLAVAFALAALLVWIRVPRRRWLAPALLLAAVAAKESALVFAAALAAASLCGLGPARPWKRLAATTAAAFALALAYGARGPWLPQFGADGALLSGAVVLHYLRGLLVPTDLSVEYPLLSAAAAAASPILPLSALAALLAATGVVAGRLLRTRPDKPRPLLFAGSWVLCSALALGALAGLHEPGADRHAYPLLAALGVWAALLASARSGRGAVWARGRLAAGTRSACAAVAQLRRPAIGAAAAIALCALAWQSQLRMRVWENQHTLWSSAVASTGGSARVQHNFAGVLAGEGSYRRALKHERKALAIDGDYAAAYLGRAAVLCALHAPQRARVQLHAAFDKGVGAAAVAAMGAACGLPEFAAAAGHDGGPAAGDGSDALAMAGAR